MVRQALAALLFMLSVVVFSLLPFASVAQEDAERLRIDGSQTIGTRLMPALTRAWLHDIGYSEIRASRRSANILEIHARRDGQPLIVEIVNSSSAQGYAELVEGRAQLAMMTRRPDIDELDAGWQLGDLSSPDQEFVLALDGVAVVVNARNPVTQLSLAQLRGVFSGRTRDWREVASASGTIRLHTLGGNHAPRDLINERVMRGDGLTTGTEHRRASDLLAAVAADPMAIAFVGVQTPLPANVKVMALSEGGRAVLPTRLGVLSEDYPLTRRLYLYGGQMMGALGRSFALYTNTRQGQRAVGLAGNMAVTLRPAAQPLAPNGPEEYRELVSGAIRLPVTLRFNFNASADSAVVSSLYDSRSARDIERLAAFMRMPANRERAVVVVGFADAQPGAALSPVITSNDRADLVAAELMSLGIRVRRARGLGAALPVSRASGRETRYRNERVELWLL